VINNISPQGKPKSGETSVNKGHNLRWALRDSWQANNLSPVRMNRSAYYLVSFQRSSGWGMSNEVPGWFLDKEDVV